MGDAVEVFGLPEIRRRWGVERPEQVIDVIALWGDVSDNIPGVPGIGEKTAIKLISQYGSVENLLEHTSELKGRVKENLEKNRSQALLSKKLATIHCDVPISVDLESLKARSPDEARLKELLVEFEFNSIGRRLFGEDFKRAPALSHSAGEEAQVHDDDRITSQERPAVPLRTLSDLSHHYESVTTAEERAALITKLAGASALGFAVIGSSSDPKAARLLGLAFSSQTHSGAYVPLPEDEPEAARVLE